MTSKFDEFNNSGQPLPTNGQEASGTQPSPEALDNLKRDRFELLSAYLDGEVTAAERHQVEVMLANDPTIQRLYARLLKLRQSIRNLPAPTSEQPVEKTVQQVVARIERRPKRTLAWGGVAIAALFVSALIRVLPHTEFAPQLAESSGTQKVVPHEGLMVALDRPPVEIPKAAVSNVRQLPNGTNVQ
jgi:anti-sigma factor RsiW